MAQEIVQHGHCQVCGRVVKYGDHTCSEGCKNELDKSRKQRRRSMTIMYILMAILLLLFIVPPLLNGGG